MYISDLIDEFKIDLENNNIYWLIYNIEYLKSFL